MTRPPCDACGKPFGDAPPKVGRSAQWGTYIIHDDRDCETDLIVRGPRRLRARNNLAKAVAFVLVWGGIALLLWLTTGWPTGH